MSLRALLVGAIVIQVAPAHAGDNDLVLSRFGTVTMAGDNVIPDNQRFRSLASELGVALAPMLAAPTDTLGYSGFQFSADYNFTTINSDNEYWCATQESASCDPGFQKTSMLHKFGIFARKGLWLPIPSFEVGAGALHLMGSDMWAGQVYGKFAVHEGFHDWPLPSIAVRGAASRLFGENQLDLTVASVDVTIGKQFGVGGSVNVQPYAGWNYLWIIPRSEVIDKTPAVDAFQDPGDINMNFVFPDQDNITRTRFFGGVKIKHYVFALTLEVNVALAGTSVDDRAGTEDDCRTLPFEMRSGCDAHDQAGAQTTFTVGVAVDI
jgi:hypothetical protein